MPIVIERILTPTDFSATSEQAVDYALDLARRLDAAVHLLHVVAQPIQVGAWPEGSMGAWSSLREQLVQEASRRLIDRALSITDVTVSTDVRDGDPARAIVAAANERGCDLIVMGTHGSGGFTKLLLGSVAERVVRTAPCPVLTVSSSRARVRRAPAGRKAKKSPAKAAARGRDSARAGRKPAGKRGRR